MRLSELRNWLGRGHRSDATDLVLSSLQPPAADIASTAGPAIASAQPGWTPQRLEIAEALWGEGCSAPGGTEELARLAAPLGLSAASSLLLLGAGSGGPAVRLAGDLGVWVGAFESDPVLAAAAKRRVQRAGTALAKRATVDHWNPAAPAFRRAAFHHAIAVEALHGDGAETVIAALARAVRPGGQLALLETVATPSLDRSDPAVRAWCSLEQRDPPRLRTDWLTGTLERLGFDIRVCEDVSARQVLQAVTGWKRLLRELRVERPTPRRAAAMVAEAEL
jgi:protein-L-isoaspartate O-methyltransferase